MGLAKDHGTAIGSVFDVPEKDIKSQCSSKFVRNKVSCVCKKAKDWAYNSCKTVVKHVDRKCMDRYSKLHLFVERGKETQVGQETQAERRQISSALSSTGKKAQRG